MSRYGYGERLAVRPLRSRLRAHRIPFRPPATAAGGIATYRSFVTEGVPGRRLRRLTVGEHGDSQSRGELLPIMFGDRVIEAFEKTKALFDPNNN